MNRIYWKIVDAHFAWKKPAIASWFVGAARRLHVVFIIRAFGCWQFYQYLKTTTKCLCLFVLFVLAHDKKSKTYFLLLFLYFIAYNCKIFETSKALAIWIVHLKALLHICYCHFNVFFFHDYHPDSACILFWRCNRFTFFSCTERSKRYYICAFQPRELMYSIRKPICPYNFLGNVKNK